MELTITVITGRNKLKNDFGDVSCTAKISWIPSFHTASAQEFVSGGISLKLRI